MHHTQIQVPTRGRGLYEFTDAATAWLREVDAGSGLLNALIHHTTASLVLLGGADRALRDDLVAFFDRLAPEGDGYSHANVGADDMPSHIKAVLTGAALTVPVIDGALRLGPLQGLFLFEHRHPPQQRRIGLAFLAG